MIYLYLFQPTFFGLTDAYAQGVYEQLFFLKQHGGWSFIEAYNLPMQLREWWINRLIKEMEDQAKAMQKQASQ